MPPAAPILFPAFFVLMHSRAIVCILLLVPGTALGLCMHAKALQPCLTLCYPMNCSPLGSSVHGILQARILGVLLRPLPGDLPNSGIEPVTLKSPALADGFFSTSTTGKPNQSLSPVNSNSLLWWFENRSPKSLTFFLLRGESMSLCLEI